MSLRKEKNPGESCPNQPNSRRRSGKKEVKQLTSLREEKNPGESCPNQPNSRRRSGKKEVKRLTSLREEHPDASCPNQPNSSKGRRRRRKKVKWLKHYSSNHPILLVGEGGLTSLREEEKPGASCPNQPNSSKRRSRRRSEKKEVKWLKHYSSNHGILLVGEGGLTSLREEENPPVSPNQPNSSRRKKSGKKEVKWLKHYSSDHRILLVGEGDFSFSHSLGMAFGDASKIVATSLDSYDVVIKKYKGAKTNLEILHSLGAKLLHEVDALQMKLHTDLQMHKFDRIIFNFPHAGFLGPEDDQKVIMIHRILVCGFFKNASGMLHPKGEVHVTHKTSYPFQSWSIKELATQNSLTLLERIEFKLEDYPGYCNKRGDGKRSDELFPLGECSTYKFVLFSKGNSSKEDGLCNCDPPLRRVEHTSWSKSNPNRRFMGCPKYRGPESEHCKSIDWIDPPLSDGRYKKAMYELRLRGRERDEKKKLMQSLTRQRNEKEAAIKALVEEKIQKEKLTEALKSLNTETDADKEKLMQSLTRAIAALGEEKIQKEKLMEALKSQNKEIDACKEKLMESLTRLRNEKEAASEALLKEKIQKEKLTEALNSLNEETDAYKKWTNKLYKRCLMVLAVLVVSYWCC